MSIVEVSEGIRIRVGKKATVYQAVVYLPGGGRRCKSFPSERSAKRWRTTTLSAIQSGKFRKATRLTVEAAAEMLIADMESGSALTRSGKPYKPSVIRSYRDNLKLHVTPRLGGDLLEKVTRADVQLLVDTMLREGANASTVRNAIMPLRVIYRRAIQRELLNASPCEYLEVPAVSGSRDRIATPEEAANLLESLFGHAEKDRPIWATAFYAGLRRGELRGLRVTDIDLVGGVIRVRQALDELGAVIEPKSKAGIRKVPIVAVLRPYLENLPTDGLAFPSSVGNGFNIGRVRRRAHHAWSRTFTCGCRTDENKPAPERCPDHNTQSIPQIGLHECRHTLASLLIAAGVNAKALSTFMGHSSIAVTYDVYGHLLDGAEAEAASRVDAFLAARVVAKNVPPMPGALS